MAVAFWPKQLRINGLANKKVDITEKGLKEVVSSYTREAGVRNLERNLASIGRKMARLVVEKKKYRRCA
jgi:ATP-dependent Lon protease